jgi:hypothetical protein
MDYPTAIADIEKWGIKEGECVVVFSYPTVEGTKAGRTKAVEANVASGKLTVKGIKISDAGTELFVRFLSPVDPKNPVMEALSDRSPLKVERTGGVLKFG